MKSTIEDTEKKLPRLEKLEMGKLDLRKSLTKLKLHSKEAEPEENMEDQGQAVITKTCKNCLNSCKIKVHQSLYENSRVNCPDYKAKPIKLSF